MDIIDKLRILSAKADPLKDAWTIDEAAETITSLRALLQNAEPVATYGGRRLTPEGTKEFFGTLLVNAIDESTNLFTHPKDSIKPTEKDKENGWSVNVDLINSIEKVLNYPAHSQAIEQIILELINRGLVIKESTGHECHGRTHQGCKYLSGCNIGCNKCGEVHTGNHFDKDQSIYDSKDGTKPANTCAAILPKGVAVTNVYDAYEEGLRAASKDSSVKRDAEFTDYLIFFHDNSVRPEIYTTEESAYKRYEQVSISWNADLFKKVKQNYKC